METISNSDNNNNDTTSNATTPTTTATPTAHVVAPTGTLPKTVSSPTTLYPVPAKQPAGTPTLGQIGKQTSVNFRLSQLSDSGADTDTDDQSRLIRTPSSRSHKFIIIPSAAISGATNGSPSAASGASLHRPFRQTISTSSLATLVALQNIPLYSSVTSYQQQQQHQMILNDATADSNPNANPHATTIADQPCSSSTTRSDVLDQSTRARWSSPAATSSSHATGGGSVVTFTIDDVDSDNAANTTATDTAGAFAADAADMAMIDSDMAASMETRAISSINSATLLTPHYSQSQPSTETASSTTTTPALSPHSPTIGGAVVGGLRPRHEYNSSMRSVLSAHVTGTQDGISRSNSNHLLQLPELNSSSYLYHDHVANQIYSDVTSVRSLASIGIGSTDGKKLVIRRVPHTPDELFSLVSPPIGTPAPPGIDDDDDDSFMDLSDDAANLKPRQQHWGSKMQFVLACVGYSVGLGNVWRFPYMCYKSGGGVFLVPYCIILFICSIPLLFMELSVGQYTGRGPIGALGQLCPLFKGAGLASVVVSFLMSTYFSVIIAYSIYYFFTAFKPFLPWTDCSNRWNTPDCWVPQRMNMNATSLATSRTPSEEFFENKVLQISPGIEYPGLMRWELFACLICAWLMVYFATWKSIKSSAKVRYFTATFPFVLIIILMCRAVTLDGAEEGLRYFFRPNWSELKNANVWINAASQNFNSLGITFGSMISFASYNKYNNNILRDTVAVSMVNILTSLLVGVFAFATLGNLALEQNTNVRDVIGDGPGLIFVVYPQAIAKMPYAQLWAVMFFFMLLCLGLNSQFAIVEVVVTSIQDGFPNWIKRHLGYHEIVVLFVCVVSFLFGLPNLIQGGIYFFQLMDHYAASVSIMFLAFCQMIAIAWFYGSSRLSKNVKQMTGKAPSLYFKSCWVLLGPCLLFAIWILSLVNYEEPTYHNGKYKYPEWAYAIGWTIASLSLVCIPGYAVVNLLRSTGNTFWKRVSNTLRPNIYECRICGEHHCEHDYPEQEQYMLAQEMSGIYKPTVVPSQMRPTAPMNVGQKYAYNPLHFQQQQQQPPQSPPHTEDQQPPPPPPPAPAMR